MGLRSGFSEASADPLWTAVSSWPQCWGGEGRVTREVEQSLERWCSCRWERHEEWAAMLSAAPKKHADWHTPARHQDVRTPSSVRCKEQKHGRAAVTTASRNCENKTYHTKPDTQELRKEFCWNSNRSLIAKEVKKNMNFYHRAPSWIRKKIMNILSLAYKLFPSRWK